MRRLAADTWDEALDFLYEHAPERAMGDASPYDELRRRYFGPDGQPGPAPVGPSSVGEVLGEFRSRLAGGLLASQHPRQFGYFTPPPLPMSMMGELLAQMANQGVDIWHAGPVAAFVEEEVVRWLCDADRLRGRVVRAADLGRGHGQLHGHGPRSRPPARPAPRPRAPAARPRARRRPGVHERPDPLLGRPRPRPPRVPRRDARHRAVRRRVPPSSGAGGGSHRARPGRRPDAVRHLGRRRVDEHGLGRRHRRARRPRRSP